LVAFQTHIERALLYAHFTSASSEPIWTSREKRSLSACAAISNKVV
jgi:hypothetical protein